MRRPASRIAIGIFAVICVSMKPGATALIVCPRAARSRRERLDPPDHAGLGGRVVGLAAVARYAAHRGDAHDPPVSRSAAAVEQRIVDALLA